MSVEQALGWGWILGSSQPGGVPDRLHAGAGAQGRDG
jgi:hypothetical protein